MRKETAMNERTHETWQPVFSPFSIPLSFTLSVSLFLVSLSFNSCIVVFHLPKFLTQTNSDTLSTISMICYDYMLSMTDSERDNKMACRTQHSVTGQKSKWVKVFVFSESLETSQWSSTASFRPNEWSRSHHGIILLWENTCIFYSVSTHLPRS